METAFISYNSALEVMSDKVLVRVDGWRDIAAVIIFQYLINFHMEMFGHLNVLFVSIQEGKSNNHTTGMNFEDN